jgi:hypothetical protein
MTIQEPPMDPSIVVEPQPTTGIAYEMYADGKIYRVDHGNDHSRMLIAKHDGANLIYEDHNLKRYHVAVVPYLKKQGVTWDNVLIDGVDTTPVTRGPTGTTVEAEEVDEVSEPAAIPKCPLKNKRDGDKTEAVVEWYRKYHPEEFKRRYGIDGPGTVTKYKKVPYVDPKTRTITPGRYTTEPFQEAALLSKRKIHLTEKPDKGGDEQYAPVPLRDDQEG